MWCGAFNFAPGDVVPLAPLGTTMPDGRTIARRGILGIDSEGMLCSARELGLGDDHSGILVLPGRRAARRALRRGARVGATTSCSTSTSPATGPTAGRYVGVARDLAAKLGVAVHAAGAAGARRRRRGRTADHGRDRRRRPLRPLHVDRAVRRRRRPVGAVDGRAADGGRHAPDQQRRRRQQLRDARARPAQPRLRPGDARRRRLPHPPRPRRRDDTTLDGVERTLERRRPADLRRRRPADRHRRDHGRRRHRDQRRDDDGRARRWPGSSRCRIGQTVARLGAALRGVGPLRAGRRPVRRSTRPIARFVELLGETCPDLVVARRRRRRAGSGAAARERSSTPCGSAEVNRILGTPLGAPTTCRRCSTRSASPCRGDGDVRTVAPARRGGPTATSEIDVIEEVARHYGYDRIGKAVPTSTVHGRLSVAQQRRRRLREVLLGLGITEAMPNPFLGPGRRSAGPGSTATRCGSPTRWSPRRACCARRCGPGLLRAIAFNESHRRHRRRAVRDRPRLPAGAGRAARRVRGARRRARRRRRRRRRSPCGGRSPPAMGVGARIDQGRVPAGLHPTRSATLSPDATSIGAVGEVAPDVLEAFGIDGAGGRARARPRVTCSTTSPSRRSGSRPAGTRRATSTWRSRCPTTCRPRGWTRRSARAPAACSSTSSCSTSTAAPASADGRRSLAYRLRLQAPDRNLTDADVAEVRQQVTRADGQARRRAARLMTVAVVVRIGPVGGPPAPAACRGGCGSSCRCCVSALLFGAVAVAVRTSGDDEGESISGPAEASCRRSSTPPRTCSGPCRRRRTIADELGAAYGEVTRRVQPSSPTSDDWPSPPRFDRLPDAEARLLGRTLGAIQAQLSPTEVDGAADGRRPGAPTSCSPSALARATVVTIDPDGTARDQALAMLPFSRPGPDRVRRPRRPSSSAGDLDALAARIDAALSDAGAAELVSSVANVVSARLADATSPTSAPSSCERLRHRRRAADSRRATPPRSVDGPHGPIRELATRHPCVIWYKRCVSDTGSRRATGRVSWRRGRRGRRRARRGGRAGGAGRAPQVVGVGGEQVVGLGVEHEPGAGLDLALELARPPAGVAAEHAQGADRRRSRRAGSAARSAEARSPLSGARCSSASCERLSVRARAIRASGSTGPPTNTSDGSVCRPTQASSGSPSSSGLGRLSTSPERALVVVLEHVDHRAVEVRVLERRGGQQEPALGRRAPRDHVRHSARRRCAAQAIVDCMIMRIDRMIMRWLLAPAIIGASGLHRRRAAAAARRPPRHRRRLRHRRHPGRHAAPATCTRRWPRPTPTCVFDDVRPRRASTGSTSCSSACPTRRAWRWRRSSSGGSAASSTCRRRSG